jgi:hypothetical protein
VYEICKMGLGDVGVVGALETGVERSWCGLVKPSLVWVGLGVGERGEGESIGLVWEIVERTVMPSF